MFPVLFRIGSFEVTSFGVLVALGALAGLWVFRREIARSRLPEAAMDAAIYGLVGGLAGAKLLYVFEHLDEGTFLGLLLDRGGMSWFGGFAGGLLAGYATILAKRWPVVTVLSAATPALAVGQLLGRIGCFLVGDDYGHPTSLPWGIAFPEGLPPTTERVHPTQIYEAIFLGVFAWMLIRWRRVKVDDRVVLGRYFVGVGGFRFLLEFLRVNTRVLGPLTVAHIFSLGVVLLGLILLLRRPSRPIR
ncbi:MAG TPA: prolipoprotein diacylglyceryl transferase family protein [Vicinamibacterales bacterium]|nr:prolipoprotein diacylglyceryl transferase family protein [Vicinamibacterales bacterium]